MGKKGDGGQQGFGKREKGKGKKGFGKMTKAKGRGKREEVWEDRQSRAKREERRGLGRGKREELTGVQLLGAGVKDGGDEELGFGGNVCVARG
ncbi:hypothetical protein ACLOJK_001675 [Asimina triloba]